MLRQIALFRLHMQILQPPGNIIVMMCYLNFYGEFLGFTTTAASDFAARTQLELWQSCHGTIPRASARRGWMIRWKPSLLRCFTTCLNLRCDWCDDHELFRCCCCCDRMTTTSRTRAMKTTRKEESQLAPFRCKWKMWVAIRQSFMAALVCDVGWLTATEVDCCAIALPLIGW